MNKWLLLLIVAGLAGAGWYKRDDITAFLATKGYSPAQFGAAATPHPATESQAKASRAYPALAKAGSPFNLRFVALYNELKQSDPAFLTQPNWPELLAQRTAADLGGGAMPVPGAAPVASAAPLQPSILDSKPKSPTATVAPTVQLPGLQGSILDQRPPPKH